jgi:hypothetical protein
VWSGPDAIIVRLEWRPTGGQVDQQRFQALRFEADKIREITEHRTLGAATRVAKRFAAQSKS